MKNPLFLFLCISLLTSCFLTTIPTTETYREMPFRKVKASEQSLTIDKEIQSMDEISIKRAFKTQTLPEFISQSESNAFLVFKNGKLRYEYYADSIEANDKHSSFSVAKSMLSALVGIAIEEGKILSLIHI